MLVLLLASCGAPTAEAPDAAPPVATFSIVAFDPATGDVGVAVQSKVFGVGSIVPYARADVGAVATQAFADPAFGPEGLRLMDEGLAASLAVERLLEGDAGRARRQLGMVDARGRPAAYTGTGCHAWAGHVLGAHHCCQGNLLAGEDVVQAMSQTFTSTKGPLAERLVAALRAGQRAGGDKRGRQSAALLVALAQKAEYSQKNHEKSVRRENCEQWESRINDWKNSLSSAPRDRLFAMPILSPKMSQFVDGRIVFIIKGLRYDGINTTFV